eukprot:gene27129-biopygen17680
MAEGARRPEVEAGRPEGEGRGRRPEAEDRGLQSGGHRAEAGGRW